jgi:ABC-type branched-subunit amino acid transport system permease subunit
LLLGIISGLLAGVAGIIYAKVYYETSEADFTSIAPNVRIMAGTLIGGVLAAIGFWLADKLLKANGEIVFNLVFSILSFASLLPIFGYRLPRTIEFPEQFPALVVPMHFFPALAWYTLKPIFFRKRVS